MTNQTDSKIRGLHQGVKVGREVDKKSVQSVVIEFVEPQLMDQIVNHLYPREE
jgi:hypothetical protein